MLRAKLSIEELDTAWKVFIFGVFLVRISLYSDWIRTRKTPNTLTFHAVRETAYEILQKTILLFEMISKIFNEITA